MFNKKILKILAIDPLSSLKVWPVRNLEKIGTEYGGWFIPRGYLTYESICYCAGAGEDISFDVNLAMKYKCKIYIFDPTPRAKAHFLALTEKTIKGERMPINNNPKQTYEIVPEALEKLHFINIGLWSKNDTIKFYAPANPSHVSHSALNSQKTNVFFEGRVDRVSNLMKNLGHKKIDLLKIDIEGAEYEVINSIIEDNLKVKIFCIEFDELGTKIDDNYLARIRAFLKKLTDFGFRILKIDGSNYTLIRKECLKNN